MMGYWDSSAGVWGDTPADIFDRAINGVERAFKQDQRRRPTSGELRAGLEFSLGSYEEPKPEMKPVLYRGYEIRKTSDDVFQIWQRGTSIDVAKTLDDAVIAIDGWHNAK